VLACTTLKAYGDTWIIYEQRERTARDVHTIEHLGARGADSFVSHFSEIVCNCVDDVATWSKHGRNTVQKQRATSPARSLQVLGYRTLDTLITSGSDFG